MCRYFGTSLEAFYRWKPHYDRPDLSTLEDRSHRPRHRRRPAPGPVHRSDRGVQYASHDYTQLLQEHGIQIGMSRKTNLWDDAACESFIKTLKYEEVYRTQDRDLGEARAGIGAFLEKIYNQKRLRSVTCPRQSSNAGY